MTRPRARPNTESREERFRATAHAPFARNDSRACGPDRSIRPDLRFVEPGGTGTAESFSFTVEGTESALGASVAYAVGKATHFPNEGGAALLIVDIPDAVVRAAALEHLALYDGIIEYDATAELSTLAALCGGVIQFDPGPALNELMAVWSALAKEIRGVP